MHIVKKEADLKVKSSLRELAVRKVSLLPLRMKRGYLRILRQPLFCGVGRDRTMPFISLKILFNQFSITLIDKALQGILFSKKIFIFSLKNAKNQILSPKLHLSTKI